jgi:hypothetical protein
MHSHMTRAPPCCCGHFTPAGGNHAELVLGLVPDTAGTPRTPVSDGGNITPPALTSTDWMRRGALAERLGHMSDARAAYRASVKLGFNLAAYTALLRLEAQAGNASDTVLCAAQVRHVVEWVAGLWRVMYGFADLQHLSYSDTGCITGSAHYCLVALAICQRCIVCSSLWQVLLAVGKAGASYAVLCVLLLRLQVLAWHQQRLVQSGSSSGSSSSVVRMGLPPEVVAWGLGLVASSSSADEVLLAAARAPNAAAELKAVLHEWSKWQQVAVPEPLQPQQAEGLQAGG